MMAHGAPQRLNEAFSSVGAPSETVEWAVGTGKAVKSSVARCSAGSLTHVKRTVHTRKSTQTGHAASNIRLWGAKEEQGCDRASQTILTLSPFRNL